MRMRKLWTRCAAFLLVLVVIFGNIAINPETLQAATKKQVKTISLRIGSKKVAKKTVTMYSLLTYFLHKLSLLQFLPSNLL